MDTILFIRASVFSRLLLIAAIAWGYATISNASTYAQVLLEAPAAMTRTALPAEIIAGKVKIRNADGSQKFGFKPKGADCKFYDAAGKELCKISLKAPGLKVKRGDKQLFEAKPKEAKLMLLDTKGKELFRFRVKESKIDFYSGEDRLKRIVNKDGKWYLEDNADKRLFYCKDDNGKMEVHNPAGKTVLYSKELKSPLGLVFFMIDELTAEQQAAAAVFFADFEF